MITISAPSAAAIGAPRRCAKAGHVKTWLECAWAGLWALG